MRRIASLLLPVVIVGAAFAGSGSALRRAVAAAHGYWLLSDDVPLQRAQDSCGLYSLSDIAQEADRGDAIPRILSAPVPKGGYSTAELQSLARSLDLPTHIVTFRGGPELGTSPLLLMLPRRRHFVVYEGARAFGFCTIYDPAVGRVLAPRAWVVHQSASFAIALDRPVGRRGKGMAETSAVRRTDLIERR